MNGGNRRDRGGEIVRNGENVTSEKDEKINERIERGRRGEIPRNDNNLRRRRGNVEGKRGEILKDGGKVGERKYRNGGMKRA